MSSVNRSFDGPLKFQSSPNSTWRPVVEDMDHYKCQYDGPISNQSRESNKYQIVDSSVKPIDNKPIYSFDFERQVS